MAPTCLACRHVRRREIDEALLAGEPLRSIAKRVSLSAAAIFRHKSHVAERLMTAHKQQEAREAMSLSQRLAELADFARRLAQEAARDGDKRTALQGCRELARLLEFEARMAGELPAGPHVQVNVANLTTTDLNALSLEQREALLDRLVESGARVRVETLRALWNTPDDA
jgi:hypothetical protein